MSAPYSSGASLELVQAPAPIGHPLVTASGWSNRRGISEDADLPAGHGVELDGRHETASRCECCAINRKYGEWHAVDDVGHSTLVLWERGR